MPTTYRTVARAAIAAIACAWATTAGSETLTADRAVQIALQHSTQAINADAGVYDAKAGLYRAYSGVMPRLGASIERRGLRIDNQTGLTFVSEPPPPHFITTVNDERRYSTTPLIQGSWTVFNLSSLSSVRAGRNEVKAAKLSRTSTRQDLALAVRRQFYVVVGTIQLALVQTQALRLARDDERRVNALFDVGSVSKSDVLKARVRTSQAELDSLTAYQASVNQRFQLASLIGVPEQQMGDVDTVMTVEPREYNEAELLTEAEKARPDIQAAHASANAARSSVTASRFARLPYLTLVGQTTIKSKSSSLLQGPSQSDNTYTGAIALNIDLFDTSIEGAGAAAKAQHLRATETYESLRRNLAGEVHQALLAYTEAQERQRVAQSAIDSGSENVKLTQQKYNVGSSTILDLIDAQVQLQRSWNDLVTARASIRVAEAGLDRVRGRGAE